MHKEYKINIWRAGYVLPMIIAPAFLGLAMLGVYGNIKYNSPQILVYLGYGGLFAGFVIFYITFFYYNKLKIIVEDRYFLFKMPNRKVTINYTDICEIVRAYGPAGVYYYIFYYDKKRKKRKVEFTQDLENSERLVKYLEKKSKVKKRQEGTVEVKETDNAVVKVVKITFNIVITMIILWLLVGWPFMHAWKN